MRNYVLLGCKLAFSIFTLLSVKDWSPDLNAQAWAACCALNIDITKLWTPVNTPSAEAVPGDTEMSLPEQASQ